MMDKSKIEDDELREFLADEESYNNMIKIFNSIFNLQESDSLQSLKNEKVNQKKYIRYTKMSNSRSNNRRSPRQSSKTRRNSRSPRRSPRRSTQQYDGVVDSVDGGEVVVRSHSSTSRTGKPEQVRSYVRKSPARRTSGRKTTTRKSTRKSPSRSTRKSPSRSTRRSTRKSTRKFDGVDLQADGADLQVDGMSKGKSSSGKCGPNEDWVPGFSRRKPNGGTTRVAGFCRSKRSSKPRARSSTGRRGTSRRGRASTGRRARASTGRRGSRMEADGYMSRYGEDDDNGYDTYDNDY